MDEFEKAYFVQLNGLASEYVPKRHLLALSRIQQFAARIYQLLVDEKAAFDVVLAAGNSGSFMIELVRLVYKEAGISLPFLLSVPLYRFVEEDGQKRIDDNLGLHSFVAKKLSGKTFPSTLRVLFVDDEIMRGITAKTALSLLLYPLPEVVHIDCVIVAEHHFFEWHFDMPAVSVRFFAYARLIQGLNGNIGYFIPAPLYEQIISVVPDVQSYNHAMAVVIGGVLKRKDTTGVGFYDDSVGSLLQEKISLYEKQRLSLLHDLKQLVVHGIRQYKEKNIVFRF